MVENNIKKTFICNLCDKEYKDKTGLWYHNKKYHSINKNKTTLTTSNLTLQLQPVVEQKQLFKCKFCDTTFTRKNNLNQHIKKTCKEKKLQMDIFDEIKKIKEDKLKNNNILFDEIKKLEKKIKQIKNQPNIINIHKPEFNKENDNTLNQIDNFTINNTQIQIYKNNYTDAIEICKLCNNSFVEWENMEQTINIIKEISKNTDKPINDLIIKNNTENILIHPLVASQLFQWINPIYGINFTHWLINKKSTEQNNIINKKNEEINELVNNFVKKKVRTKYPDTNVIYLLTTEFHKKNNIYIVGKAKDLASRLSTYNKTCEHEVVYYASCENEEVLKVVENMVLTKLNSYREVANRDRFILPVGKPLSFFTDVIDEAIGFLKLNKIKKPIDKSIAISKIQNLIDEINSHPYFC